MYEVPCTGLDMQLDASVMLGLRVLWAFFFRNHRLCYKEFLDHISTGFEGVDWSQFSLLSVLKFINQHMEGYQEFQYRTFILHIDEINEIYEWEQTSLQYTDKVKQTLEKLSLQADKEPHQSDKQEYQHPSLDTANLSKRERKKPQKARQKAGVSSKSTKIAQVTVVTKNRFYEILDELGRTVLKAPHHSIYLLPVLTGTLSRNFLKDMIKASHLPTAEPVLLHLLSSGSTREIIDWAVDTSFEDHKVKIN